MNYAGIGSRETPPHVLQVMCDIGTLMAIDGHICNTGAALGADQAFANGANKVKGLVTVALPWASYERAWVESLHNTIVLVYNEHKHIAARASVTTFHPAAGKLTRGAFSLHARNFLIVEHCELIICWTVDGKASGGTGQGIRIAESLGIPVMNLGDPLVLGRFIERIKARSNELEAYTKHSAPE